MNLIRENNRKFFKWHVKYAHWFIMNEEDDENEDDEDEGDEEWKTLKTN